MLHYRITTLGCKVNQYEGQALGATLQAWGLEPLGNHRGPADLIVVNTCCITTTAMRKSRQALRRMIRTNPRAAVFVTGCYAQYHRRKMRALLDEAGVGWDRSVLAGHHDDVHKQLQALVQDLRSGRAPGESVSDSDAQPEPDPGEQDNPAGSLKTRRLEALRREGAKGTAGLAGLSRFAGHQRAFVKIQDGCDAFCSYCVVPYMRPRIWSREPADVLSECARLVAAGHKEIVLCGVFLGAFGRPSTNRGRWNVKPAPLAGLVDQVARIPGLWKVRLSSLEPGDVTDDLLEVLKYHTVAPHLHLPLQSGSPDILSAMNRKYTPREFLETAARLQEQLDRPCLTTDVIVGFPGESQEDFKETLRVAKQAGFGKIHAFAFSAIPGTAAWKKRRQGASASTVKERMGRLARLEAQLAQEYRRSLLGQPMEALVERIRDGLVTCMTDRYVTATLPADGWEPRPGSVIRFLPRQVTAQGLKGALLGQGVVSPHRCS
jgi:threonylcarbamoyladenosine tRNA methylthiotransferase MtaB